MHKYFLIAAVLAVIASLLGCQTASTMPDFASANLPPTNLTPANLLVKPSVQIYKDSGFGASHFKTFAVFPPSKVSQDAAIKDEVLERQMLFVLRNYFESRGYRFVAIDQSPDLLVTVDGSSTRKDKHTPPQTFSIPYWVEEPAQAPRGHLAPQAPTRPDGATEAFSISVIVSVYDAKSFKNIWLGTGTGISDNPDLRVSSQALLMAIFNQFPNCRSRFENYPQQSGTLGLGLIVTTSEGTNYYPTVLKISENSPAQKAGVEINDMVVAIDGIPTLNKTISEISPLIYGEAGRTVSMTIKRLNQIRQAEIIRVPIVTKENTPISQSATDAKVEQKAATGSRKARAMEFFEKGQNLAKSGDHQKAVEAFDNAIRLNPEMVASYLYQGISFIGAGKYQQAIDDFTAAIGLNPQSAQIFLQRAQAYHKMGDYARAMNDMKTAAKLGSKEAQDFLKPLGVPWE